METVYKFIKEFLGKKDAYVFPLHTSFANTCTTVELRGVQLDCPFVVPILE